MSARGKRRQKSLSERLGAQGIKGWTLKPGDLFVQSISGDKMKFCLWNRPQFYPETDLHKATTMYHVGYLINGTMKIGTTSFFANDGCWLLARSRTGAAR